MTEITLTIAKDDVYQEVSRTSEYTGSKIQDPSAYENIATTDEDKDILNRFWNESKSIVCNSLKNTIIDATETDIEIVIPPKPQPEGVTPPLTPPTLKKNAFVLKLGLSDAFDMCLKDSMQSSLFSFFVLNIVSKWYTFCNKPESTDYATEAAGCIEDIKRKAYFKKKPKRPTYNK